MSADGKRTIEETYANGAALTGTFIFRLSVAPYNTTASNRYTTFADLISFIVTQVGSAPKFNLQASTDPGPNDDTAHGYSLNSLWFNATDGTLWIPESTAIGIASWINAFKSVQNPQGNGSYVAEPGGGQSGATQMRSHNNKVIDVATNGDSLKLLAGVEGMEMQVYVQPTVTGDPIVWPQSGETINGVADNPITIFKGNLAIFKCVENGKWMFINTTI